MARDMDIPSICKALDLVPSIAKQKIKGQKDGSVVKSVCCFSKDPCSILNIYVKWLTAPATPGPQHLISAFTYYAPACMSHIDTCKLG